MTQLSKEQQIKELQDIKDKLLADIKPSDTPEWITNEAFKRCYDYFYRDNRREMNKEQQQGLTDILAPFIPDNNSDGENLENAVMKVCEYFHRDNREELLDKIFAEIKNHEGQKQKALEEFANVCNEPLPEGMSKEYLNAMFNRHLIQIGFVFGMRIII